MKNNLQLNAMLEEAHSIFKQDTAPDKPEKNDIWFQTANNQVKAMFIFDGIKWIAQTLSQEIMNNIKLTTNDLNSFSVNSAKFTNKFRQLKKDGSGNYVDGTMKIENGSLDINMPSPFDPDNQSVNTSLSTDGLRMGLTKKDGSSIRFFTLEQSGIIMGQGGKIGQLRLKELTALNNVGKKLWSGVGVVNDKQTITPSMKLSECLTGWILCWQAYSNGAAQKWDYNYTHIPKVHAQYASGQGLDVMLTNATQSNRVSKYLYVTDSTIKGTANNGVSPQSKWVLTAVYAY